MCPKVSGLKRQPSVDSTQRRLRAALFVDIPLVAIALPRNLLGAASA
jgi:hypothetical protein